MNFLIPNDVINTVIGYRVIFSMFCWQRYLAMHHLICRVEFTPEDIRATRILADNKDVIGLTLREKTVAFADI